MTSRGLSSTLPNICANGPAVCFSKRNPTTAPGSILVPRASGADKLSWCKEGLARFLASGYKFLWGLRVSRYKLSRRQRTVTVHDFNCGQMRVSGCNNYCKFVLGAGAIKNRDKLIKHTVRVSCCPYSFAPAARSILTTSLFPSCLARFRGVKGSSGPPNNPPSFATAFGSAPCFNNNCTISLLSVERGLVPIKVLNLYCQDRIYLWRREG